MARAEQRKQFPLTNKLHIATPWYVRFDGGESMPDVYGRFRDFQGTLHRDPSYTIRNCSITHYSRVNPNNPSDVRDKLHWRRMIYPDAIDQSPDGGQWVELPGRQRFTGAELLRQADFAPRLIEEV